MTNSKRHNISLLIFIFSIFLIMQSCSDSQQKAKTTADIFTPEELITIHEIVGYFDSIVSSKLPETTDIGLAYNQYLDSICPLMLKKGNIGLSGINARSREKLFDKLNQDHLGEIFIVGDTLEYFSMDVKKKIKKYYPYYVVLNSDGKYVDLLKSLSEENTFISNYYESIIEYEDLSPGCYGMILRDYDQLDFSDSDHRLLFIVNILHSNEQIKDRFRR